MTVLLKNPWILLGLGAVYVIETLSVIIQVSVFKRTQKRVFLMSPLHHHFELMAISERKIIWLFYIIAAVATALVCGAYG